MTDYSDDDLTLIFEPAIRQSLPRGDEKPIPPSTPGTSLTSWHISLHTMKSITLVAVAAYLASAVMADSTPTVTLGVEQPSATPQANTPVVQGCFSSSGELTFVSNETYNSRGRCGTELCNQKYGKYVGASTQGKECWCGDKYPPKSALVDDSNCNAPCTGYGQDACSFSPCAIVPLTDDADENRWRWPVLDRVQYRH